MSHRALHDLLVSPFMVVDPGDAGSIVIDRWGLVCPVVTAGAETRTLVQPTKPGLLATVVLDTDGGDLTLTVTGGYNEVGDTTVVLNDAGDWLTFVSVKIGANYRWRILAREGVVTSTPDRATVVQQGNPTDLANDNATLTIDQLLTGLITMEPGTGRTLTLPTGTLTDAGVSLAIDEAFDWSVVNKAANTHAITVAAGGDHTVVGGMGVAAASSGLFRTRKTAADTFVTYRIA